MRSDARKRIARRPASAPLVGMIGKKRAGKDSFAATLVEERGFTRYAFADPLKVAALGLDPIVSLHEYAERRLSDVVAAEGWERAKEIPEVRRTLQHYGVAIREIDPTFWVRATMTPALAHRGPVVITDVRFPNEAEAIREAGGIVVRVTRPGMTHDDTHVSETALDGFAADLDVLNSGTLDMLAETARTLPL